MSVHTLRDELLSLPGVADAEVEGEGVTPDNVRVRLHPEADPSSVGAEVQRVLASHGMRSRVTGDDAPPAPVVSLPAADLPIPPRPTMPPPVSPVAAEGPQPESAFPRPVEPSAGGSALASLTVEESVDGVTVVATAADGRRFSQRTATTEEAVAAAVVAVVGALAEGRPPRLLSVTLGATEGTEVVTVLVERVDGTRTAGAAVVKAGRAYAVARATWAALRA